MELHRNDRILFINVRLNRKSDLSLKNYVYTYLHSQKSLGGMYVTFIYHIYIYVLF